MSKLEDFKIQILQKLRFREECWGI